jgi:hypothetical protein
MRNFINFKLFVFLLSHGHVAVLWVLLEDKCPPSSAPLFAGFISVKQCALSTGLKFLWRTSFQNRLMSVQYLYEFRLFLQDAALNAGSPVLRLTRAGETAWGELPGEDWTIFSPNHSTYEPLAWATRNSEDFLSAEMSRTPLATVLQVCVQLTAVQFCGAGGRACQCCARAHCQQWHAWLITLFMWMNELCIAVDASCYHQQASPSCYSEWPWFICFLFLNARRHPYVHRHRSAY